MNENKYIEVKEDLKSIIDAAFYEFDDYVTDCLDKDEHPVIDVEEIVADAIIKAGYVKQHEGKWVNNHCSVCGMTPIGEETWERHGETPPRFELFMDYCPTCGARMRGGERE